MGRENQFHSLVVWTKYLKFYPSISFISGWCLLEVKLQVGVCWCLLVFVSSISFIFSWCLCVSLFSTGFGKLRLEVKLRETGSETPWNWGLVQYPACLFCKSPSRASRRLVSRQWPQSFFQLLGTRCYRGAPLHMDLWWKQTWVVVSNIFYFHLYLGKIPNLTNMFQRGWNHQLDLEFVFVGDLLLSTMW